MYAFHNFLAGRRMIFVSSDQGIWILYAIAAVMCEKKKERERERNMSTCGYHRLTSILIIERTVLGLQHLEDPNVLMISCGLDVEGKKVGLPD
jgi:hypothetical protein